MEKLNDIAISWCPPSQTNTKRGGDQWRSLNKKKKCIGIVISPTIVRDRDDYHVESSLKDEALSFLASTKKIKPETDIIYCVPKSVIEGDGDKPIDVGKVIAFEAKKGYVLYDETGEFDSLIEPGFFKLSQEGNLGYAHGMSSLDDVIVDCIASGIRRTFANELWKNIVGDDMGLRFDNFVGDHPAEECHRRMKIAFEAFVDDLIDFPLTVDDVVAMANGASDNLNSTNAQADEQTSDIADDLREKMLSMYRYLDRDVLFDREDIDDGIASIRNAAEHVKFSRDAIRTMMKQTGLPLALMFPPNMNDAVIPDIDKGTWKNVISAIGAYEVIDAHIKHGISPNDLLAGLKGRS